MKVLHFFDGRRNNTRIIQIDFILLLQNYCKLYVYGPREQENNGDIISPIKFNPKLKSIDIIDELAPDVILLPEYSLTTLLMKKLGEFKNTKDIPVVTLEVDYYSIQDNPKWFNEHGIDFIINRGPYSDCVYTVPHVWLPWSANNMFYTDEKSDYLYNRINKILFAGGGRYSRNKYYSIRQKAIHLLEAEGLIDFFDVMPPEQYKEYLSKYISFLSCSFAGLNMAPAKTFEIMASGTALLTTDFMYKDVLFGDKQCFFEYKKDCSDVVDKAIEILNNYDLVKEVTQNALQRINTYHLHSHRILELYNILEALVSGKEVPKRWGI